MGESSFTFTLKDYGGRRLGRGRRLFSYSGHIPERRTEYRRIGEERRSGEERRIELDRRNVVSTETFYHPPIF